MSNKREFSSRSEGYSWISKLIGAIKSVLSTNREERAKIRQRKLLGKKLQARCPYFNPKRNIATASFGLWFYGFYRYLSPSARWLERFAKSDLEKTLFIEEFLPEKTSGILEKLDRESIVQLRSEGVPVNEITLICKKHLKQLDLALDEDTIVQINTLYSNYQVLRTFCNFPFYFLVRKFDNNLSQQDFKYKPDCQNIAISYIKDDLIDFTNLLYSLDPNARWKKLFRVFGRYREGGIVPPQVWGKVLSQRKSIINNDFLVMIIQYITEDFEWKPKLSRKNYRLVEEYKSKLNANVMLTLQQLVIEEKKAILKNLVVKIFGDREISTNEYYHERKNVVFQKKFIKGYTFIEPMNYLKTFFEGYFKEKMRAFSTIMFLKAQWISKERYNDFIKFYRNLADIEALLKNFDIKLSDKEELGKDLKVLLHQNNSLTLKNAKTVVNQINEEARTILNSAIEALQGLGNSLNSLNDECKNKASKIIANWNDIKKLQDGGVINEVINESAEKIQDLSQLLLLLMESSRNLANITSDPGIDSQ